MRDKPDNQVASAAGKQPRHRSPNYPAVGLRAAVGKAEVLYKGGGLAPLMKVTAVKQMGFGNLDGNSARMLSALKSFGLIEEIGDDRIKLSQRAVDILVRQKDDPQHSTAIQAAANAPSIYRELLTQFSQSGIPGDSALKSELIAAKGFNPRAVDGFIRDLRDTLEFAGLTEPDALEIHVKDQLPPVEEPTKVRDQNAGQPVTPLRPPQGQTRITKETLNQRVSPDCVVQVVFDGPVTQRAVEKLIAYLELAKDDYPTNN